MTGSYGKRTAAVEGRIDLLSQKFAATMLGMALGLAMVVTTLAAGSANAQDTARPMKIVALGDSLTAGYGLPAANAFPVKLQAALKEKGIAAQVINAGVSGDTASGGRDRLEWSVPKDADAVIVELGANDALRGVDPKVTYAALDTIITKLKARNVAVFLCGMLAPPNYGGDYSTKFNAIYGDLAKKHSVPLYPFFLDGVATNAQLNQRDGIHPTAAGVDIIVKNILPSIEAFLKTGKSATRS